MARFRPHFRAFGLETSLWLFGLATSVLLLSLWGRSVSQDHQALGEAAADYARAGRLGESLADWIGDGLEMEAPAAGGLAEALEGVVESDEFDAAMSRLVAGALAASGRDAASTEGDVSEALTPLADDVAAELHRLGYPVTADEVRQRLEALPPLVVSGERASVLVATVGETRRTFTVATVIATIATAFLAMVSLALATDRRLMIRHLAKRVMLSGLSFLVFLRLGSWVLSPTGGASPLRAGTATLMRSSTEVPVIVGLVGAAAVAATFVARRRKGEHDPEVVQAGPTTVAPPGRLARRRPGSSRHYRNSTASNPTTRQ